MIARLMGLPTISPAELHRRMGTERIDVLDVKAPGSWHRARVPGARPLDPVAFGAADLPADRDATLVFYCSNPLCRKAPSAARRARGMGYANVLVMSAGIKGWMSAALPTESGEATT